MSILKSRGVLIKIFLGFSLFLFCVFFFQFDSFISDNYQVKEYEQRARNLSLDNEKLSMDFVQVNRIDNIESTAKQLNFEKPDTVHYITSMTGGVASK